jgi:hypothetical protein
MRQRFLASASLVALLATAACGYAPATSPTQAASSATSLLSTSLKTGTFASTQSVGAQQGTCGGFSWTISNITATSVSGNFSATCNGSVQMSGSGSAQGTLANNGTINWTGNGTATVPGNSNCSISLSGTVEVTATGLRIPYSGTTCLGPVSGTEVLAAK